MYPENREIISDIIYKVLVEFGDKKDIWMWTGYTYEELLSQINPLNKNDDIDMILNLIDVVVDGPYIESKRDISLPYMGSSNQRVIDCMKTTGYDDIVLWWAPEEKGK